MRPKLFGRIVLAVFSLALFGFYLYCHVMPGPFTEDLGAPEQTYAPWTAEEEAAPAEQAEALPAEAEEAAAPAEEASEATPEPPAPTVDPNSPYGKALANAAAQGLPEPPNVDVTQWQYVLVNGDHPVDPIDYEPADLVYLNQTGADTDIRSGYDGNREVVDAMIAQPLIDMTQACKAAGLPVYLSSGYRSYSVQASNFERVCRNNGITDGKNGEGNYITMPAGHSEHQTGLCCDITDRYYEIKNDSIAQVETVQWLGAHCAEYGFILRFPQDKRDITRVMGESWHFRYVGVEAATYMTDNNLCLEEFLALYGVV